MLLDATQITVLESDQTFPSETRASAAALAFAKLVTRAGRSLAGGLAGGMLELHLATIYPLSMAIVAFEATCLE